MVICSLNLSTEITSGPYACSLVSPNNYSNVNFNINWDDIFKGKTGIAQLNFKLCSKSSNTILTFNSTMGSVLLSGLALPYSNSGNIGHVYPTVDTLSTVPATINGIGQLKGYLYGQNLNSNGVTVIIPQGYSQLNIQVQDLSGNLINITENYIIWLYFDVLEL